MRTSTRRPVAVLDLDGTLHSGTLGLALLRELAEHGVCDGEQVRSLTNFLHASPYLHTRPAAAQAYQLYAKALQGVRIRTVEQLAHTAWEKEHAGLFDYATTALRLLEQTHTVVLLSGSPHEIVAPAAASLGIGLYQGARMAATTIGESQASMAVYTGRVWLAPGMPGVKPGMLARIIGTRHVPPGSIGVGNSAADIALLSWLEHPVAFEPHPPLRETATRRGWAIADRATIMPLLRKLCADQARR